MELFAQSRHDDDLFSDEFEALSHSNANDILPPKSPKPKVHRKDKAWDERSCSYRQCGERTGPLEKERNEMLNNKTQASSIAPPEPSRVPAVRGDRSLTGGLSKTKLTEAELCAKLEKMRIINASKIEKYRLQEADQAAFQCRDTNLAKEVRDKEERERTQRLEMEKERLKNRERKIQSIGRREWDIGKQESDFTDKRIRARVYMRDSDRAIVLGELNIARESGPVKPKDSSYPGKRTRGLGGLDFSASKDRAVLPSPSNVEEFPSLPPPTTLDISKTPISEKFEASSLAIKPLPKKELAKTPVRSRNSSACKEAENPSFKSNNSSPITEKAKTPVNWGSAEASKEAVKIPFSSNYSPSRNEPLKVPISSGNWSPRKEPAKAPISSGNWSTRYGPAKVTLASSNWSTRGEPAKITIGSGNSSTRNEPEKITLASSNSSQSASKGPEVCVKLPPSVVKMLLAKKKRDWADEVTLNPD